MTYLGQPAGRGLWLALVMVGACSSIDGGPTVEVSAVDPPAGPEAERVALRIDGRGFQLAIEIDVSDDTSEVGLPVVTLGGAPLEDVAWVSEERIDAVVPDDLAIGLHGLAVEFPDGRTGSLPDAYEVLGPVLVFTSAEQTVTAGECSGEVSAEIQNGVGGARVATADVDVVLSADSATMTLFADAGCATAVGAVTVPAGASAASFYFSDTTAGAPEVTVAATGLISATQVETIGPGAATQLAFETAPQMLPMCRCSAVATVVVVDVFGNRAPVSADTRVTLSGSSRSLSFYSDAVCTLGVRTISIAAGADAASFHFFDESVEAPILSASAPGLGSVDQLATVTPGSLNTWYADADGDGFGDASVTVLECARPAGFVADDNDCDDDPGDCGAGCFPGNPAADVCDGDDQDCDAAIDENPDITWFEDADGDTFGNPASATNACAAPVGFVANDLDCADMAGPDPACGGLDGARCNPLVPEAAAPDPAVCLDSADNDCDGFVDALDADCMCSGACGGCGGACCTEVCPAGDCTLSCSGGCTCIHDCSGTAGHCFETCDASVCYIDCSDIVGECNANCQNGATCFVDCTNGAQCHRIDCFSGSDCVFDCTGSTDCDLECLAGSTCLLDCTGATDCFYRACDGPQTSCPGDIIACNRACP